MAFLSDETEIYNLLEQAQTESQIWRKDYHEYERLADNDLIDDLDETLPEVNDGSLAASLFKLPKRIVNSNLKGRAKSIDRDEAWITELANLQWENKIIPNANSQAPFHRKWKDAVRKAAIYGSVPLITLFVERGDYIGADFIVAQPQDVLLEPGKVSDYDSDLMFWEVYFTKLQVESLIERAKKEMAEAKENKEEGYNKWNIQALKEILDSNPEEERDTLNDHKQAQDEGVKKKGIKFCIVFQRGVDAPFYMYHKATKTTVREWSNPDPSGDLPIHFLYCYQDFVNPYGIGIVKLAGGTQNVLDYMRQADVLATQLGFRPPKLISGDADSADLDSFVYAQDADWYAGNAKVERMEISNQVYSQLPTRVQMYQSSLNKLIPTGDTSVSAEAGDPTQSKTPAGVRQAVASLSIDDEDFKDNLYMTFTAKAKSMINYQFANMQGTDLMKLSDEERDMLSKAGLEFPVDENGVPTNELEIIWDEARATFDFEVDPEADKTDDEQMQLEGKLRAYEMINADPNIDAYLQMAGKRLNRGELLGDIFKQLTDNDKIIEEIDPEEMEQMEAEQMQQEQMTDAAVDPATGEVMPFEGEPTDDDLQQIEQDNVNLQAVMQEYGVDENTAMALLEAERQGLVNSPEEAIEVLRRQEMRMMEQVDER